jgi:hypothetical protein
MEPQVDLKMNHDSNHFLGVMIIVIKLLCVCVCVDLENIIS